MTSDLNGTLAQDWSYSCSFWAFLRLDLCSAWHWALKGLKLVLDFCFGWSLSGQDVLRHSVVLHFGVGHVADLGRFDRLRWDRQNAFFVILYVVLQCVVCLGKGRDIGLYHVADWLRSVVYLLVLSLESWCSGLETNPTFLCFKVLLRWLDFYLLFPLSLIRLLNHGISIYLIPLVLAVVICIIESL